MFIECSSVDILYAFLRIGLFSFQQRKNKNTLTILSIAWLTLLLSFPIPVCFKPKKIWESFKIFFCFILAINGYLKCATILWNCLELKFCPLAHSCTIFSFFFIRLQHGKIDVFSWKHNWFAWWWQIVVTFLVFVCLHTVQSVNYRIDRRNGFPLRNICRSVCLSEHILLFAQCSHSHRWPATIQSTRADTASCMFKIGHS